MNRTFQPGNSLSREFEEVLFDKEEELHEEITVYPDLPVFGQEGDGLLVSLTPHDPEEEDPPLISDYEDDTDAINPLISDSEDDAEWTAKRRRIDAVSHLPSGGNPEANRTSESSHSQEADCSSAPVQSLEPVRFRIELLPPPSKRGGVATRGRGRPRGRGNGDRRLIRGEPLEQRYIDDTELPEQIREEIRILAAKNSQLRRNMEEERVDESFSGMNEGFVWKPMSEWNGVKENFEPETTGPTRPIHDAYEALKCFWTDEIMSHIAKESNTYAQSLAASRPRFKKYWYDTNADEMWVLFAFWIMLGIIKMPSIKSCFTTIPILRIDIFRRLFVEERYWNVNAAFHLAEGADPNNPLHPMGPIIDHLNTKFQEMYRLDQGIRIDESLTLCNGTVGLKLARFGIKSYQLCESATGYLWAVYICIDRGSESSSMPSSAQTVLRLLRPVLNLGHTLYIDSWFNTPMLARWLKRHKTDCVGPLHATKDHVPLELQRCPLANGQFIARASEDVMVLSVQDRERVAYLSTYHDVSQLRKVTRPGHPGQFKLKVIDDYNKNKRRVDRLDQMLETYMDERRLYYKWNTKVFKHFLNVSIQNARILVEKSTNTKTDSLAFRLAIVQEIVQRHLPNVPQIPQRPLQLRPERLTERHFLRRIPITEEMRQSVKHRSNLGRRNCVWCTRKGRRNTKSVYECTECNEPLCLETCFREYHTIE